MKRPEKNQFLFGHIALHIVPGYSAGARRVGAALIEHFNKTTGQCDPSVMRLAKMLGLSRRKVLDATAELCAGNRPLFRKASHGGHSHRAAYLPMWERLSAIVDDWDLRMKDGSAPRADAPAGADMVPPLLPAKVQKTAPSRGRKLHVEGAENCTQTDRSNRQKKTGAVEAGKQATMLLPINGGGTSKSQAARTAAERRLYQAIRQQPEALATALSIETTEVQWDIAAEAEKAKPGTGLQVLTGLVRKTG